MKKTAKRECEFEFEVQGKRVRIEGRLLEARPEDRIKIFAKKMRMV
ncbi:MAG TPA: ribonuclease P protein subunit [Candidatus Diapherotrites archaeon]|uniref:Ribonuclease P protein subunit n=1 Tax=Candidatus Iainarchaeum sp. TaxID=3101447 RepID=A0A7J4JYC3_9ARCH|nr:ribonuclease P protein subunit [Candidatus Diapherotrites archaeon]